MSYISFVLDDEVEIIYLDVKECTIVNNKLTLVGYGLWGDGTDQYELFKILMENKESIRRIMYDNKTIYNNVENTNYTIDFDLTGTLSLKLVIEIKGIER